MTKKQKPRAGDRVDLRWVDIYFDPTGNPEEAHLKTTVTGGFYIGRRRDPRTGVMMVVLTNTTDKNLDEIGEQAGYLAFLAACVLDITVVEKRRDVQARLAKGA